MNDVIWVIALFEDVKRATVPFLSASLDRALAVGCFSKTHVYTRSHHHMHNARCQVECLCENMLSIYRMMCRINLLPINICFWFVLFFVCSPCVSTSLFFLRGQYTFRAKRNNKLKMYIDSSFFSFLCLPEFISCM